MSKWNTPERAGPQHVTLQQLRHRRRRRAATVAVAFAAATVAATAACRDGGPQPAEPGTHVNQMWVTGAAAAALDGQGRFTLVTPSPGGATPELGAAQATALAQAYVRFYGPLLLPTYVSDHGASIDLATVAPCGRALYAASPYAAPPASATARLRSQLGAQWLVTLCSAGGSPAISVAVSALATDLTIERDHIAPQTSPYFISSGIPVTLTGVPVSPEDAARLAAEGTGRKVAEVPQLVLPPLPQPPQLARWRVVLDAPIAVRGERSGTQRTTAELYAGFGDTWHWTGLQAPDPRGNARSTITDYPGDRVASAVSLPLLGVPGLATALERVTVEGH